MKIREMLGALQIDKILDKGADKHARLMTEWGEEIMARQPQAVLTEYPRPQMARRGYTILNGMWRYAFTGDAMRPSSYDGAIRVPFSPETVLSGVERQLMPGESLWYDRGLKIDRILPDKRLLLQFGACDERCRVYINGVHAGSHSGGYQAFTIDITAYIHTGMNTLQVCVQDESDTSYHGRGKQKLKNGGMFYTAQSGLWQTVWYEWVPEVHIRELMITPDYDHDRVHIRVLPGKTDLEGQIPYKILVFDGTHVAAESRGAASLQEELTVTVDIPGKKSWTPDVPFLYDLRIVYGMDMVESYLGMRHFSVEPDSSGLPRLCLNHEPLFQKGILDQGYYPESLMTPVSDAAMIADIETAKAKGFNMMRKHCKIEPMRWYYHCDRLGMLVWQDMINGGSTYNLVKTCYVPTVLPALRRKKDDDHAYMSRADEKGREEWKKECLETVRQLYNCTCICTWVLFNEGWGQFDAKENTDMVRAIDSTRFIDAHSGWFDQDAGDLKSEHIYFFDLVMKKSAKPYVISEFGGISHAVAGHTYSDRHFGYGSRQDAGALKAAYQALDQKIEEMEKEGLCASVYTQLTDIEEEINGIMTYDRKVVKI